MSLKKLKSLPVCVVEDHNHALEFIYKSMGSMQLPLEKNIIVHIDSHPDLMIPKDMPVEVVLNKYELFNSLSIENWLIPACYAGHFDTVLWVKPAWSNQIPLGNFKIILGNYLGFIRLYSSIYYFLSDGVCVPENHLKNVKKLTLNVCQMGDIEQFQKTLFNKNYVLDIDLDFFSTKNPFKQIYKNGDLYEKLKPLFSFDVPSDAVLNVPEEIVENKINKELVCNISKKRDKQLKKLENIFMYLEEHNAIDETKLQGEDEYTRYVRYHLTEIIRCVNENYPKIDWATVHSAGLTCDATDLPEHIATESELIDSIRKFEVFLKALKTPPTLVTIARSTNDDYCPSEQVDFIQTNILNLLQNVFGEISVKYHYEKKPN